MIVYLDNAATTPIDPQVVEAMMPWLTQHFGNPSSIHTHGRQVRAAIEKARKTIASLIGASPAEIFFTSGGTEADNMAIVGAVQAHQIQHIISSDLEHHAVLHTLENMHKKSKTTFLKVNLLKNGLVDYTHLEELLSKYPKTLVSLMHGNNEIANLLDLEKVGHLCQQYGALFHSDTVQTMGHYQHDVKHLSIHYLVGSAHKFHGPKGVGFLYVKSDSKIPPFIHGGSQERNMRGGTENVYGIMGMAKALEIAYADMETHKNHVKNIKKYMIERLKEQIAGVQFNGTSDDVENSLYTVLNVSLPPSNQADMLLFNLDIAKISVSGGSACSSGSDVGSHVLTALNVSSERSNVRFSFSKYNTKEEIDYVVDVLSKYYPKL